MLTVSVFSEASQYAEFLRRLPMLQHKINAFDGQPCTQLSATIYARGACGILLNVTGTFKYEDSAIKHAFSQTFVHMPDDNQASNYYIQGEQFLVSHLFLYVNI